MNYKLLFEDLFQADCLYLRRIPYSYFNEIVDLYNNNKIGLIDTKWLNSNKNYSWKDDPDIINDFCTYDRYHDVEIGIDKIVLIANEDSYDFFSNEKKKQQRCCATFEGKDILEIHFIHNYILYLIEAEATRIREKELEELERKRILNIKNKLIEQYK